MMKKRFLAGLTALCCSFSVIGMLPVQAASHTFETQQTDEWYEQNLEAIQDQWVLEDGILCLAEGGIEVQFEPYIPHPGTFDRSPVLLTLLHAYPDGKFAVRLDSWYEEASEETRALEDAYLRENGIDFIPLEQAADSTCKTKYAVLTAEQLEAFPVYEKVGYQIGLAKASDVLETEELSPGTEYIVVGVDDAENPQEYVIYAPEYAHTFYLPQSLLQDYFVGETLPAYGDILSIQGDICLEPLAATTMFCFLSTGTITVKGSVFEDAVYTPYTVEGMNDFTATLSNESDSHYYYIDYTDSYLQPDGIDWSTAAVGDEVTFLTYNGSPVIPTAISRLGDANADGDVSIVDVIMVNRHVMGADMARTTMNTDAADFDKNGEVTHEDSLSILKRLVGLV